MIQLSLALAVLAVQSLSALAVPSLPNLSLPHHVRAVAYDEDANRIIAFDDEGNNLGSYPVTATPGRSLSKRAGTCTPMTKDDIGKLAGIEKLRDEADKLWGDGKRNEVVNDERHPESPANICADDEGVLIVYDEEPECRELTNKASGTLEGGKITLENNEGVNMATTTEVTKSASFGVGTSISVGFSFPGIADVTAGITTTSEFSNTQGTSNAVGSDQRTLQRIEQPVDEGQSCEVLLKTKSCEVRGKGSLKMIATGLLWFQYEDKVDGHFKWGLNIESVPPNVDDRSSAIDFKSTGSVSSDAHFSSSGCTKDETTVPA